MKQKAKTFFYGITAVLTFSLVLGACPNNTSPKPKDTSVLKLSGQVYIQSTDPAALLLNYGNEKYTGNLDISDGGLGGSGEITNGKLTYTIDVEPPLSPINEGGGLDYLKERYSSLKFSPEDANATAVVFEIIDDEEYGGLLKGLLNVNMSYQPLTIKVTIKTVNYVYVDRDLKITADKDTFVYTDSGFPITLTTEKIKLNLKKGWNALYSEITAQSDIPPELLMPSDDPSDPDSQGPDLSALNPKGNLKMSVSDPSRLKWTLIPSQSSDDPEPEYPDSEQDP